MTKSDIKVKKRDGLIDNFEPKKIFDAILAASKSVYPDEDESKFVDELVKEVYEEVISKITTKRVNVEKIQDIILSVLKEKNKKIYKAYKDYRDMRNQIRDSKSKMMNEMRDLIMIPDTSNDIKRENANIDGASSMGTMLRVGSEMSKEFYLSNVLKPEHAEAHRKGYIHIHDLDFYALTTTCCQIDAKKLFETGFNNGHGYIRSPRSIRSAASLMCIIIQSNQNDQHGGQSIPNFDYALAPYVNYSLNKYIKKYGERYCRDAGVEYVHEEMTYTEALSKIKELDPNSVKYKYLKDSIEDTKDETFQAMEALVHNLNTMQSRAGSQVPFSSINYGTDTSEEGRLVMRSVLQATINGLGHHETSIFPIHIFKCKEGVNFNPGDPNYDVFKEAIKCSSQRLFPNFEFLDATFNLQYYNGTPESECATMGCRTRVIANHVDPTKETSYGRGNLSFTSINLPRLAIEAAKEVTGSIDPSDKDIDKKLEVFYKKLDHYLELCKDQLLDRYEIQCARHVYNYPSLMGNHIWIDSDKLGPNDEVREVLKQGTLSIGFIGLAEALKELTGKHHGESEDSQKIGLSIVGRMNDYCKRISEQYNLNFGIIGTPAEGLSGRFINIDRKIYGEIPGVIEHQYYTNSSHVPVYYQTDMFHKIDVEAPYHEIEPAGHISYIELHEGVSQNPDAFEQIIRYMEKANMGYVSINFPVDTCPYCGYTGVINDTCPACSKKEDALHKFKRIRRITGYLVGDLSRFNNAKFNEVADRVKHDNVN